MGKKGPLGKRETLEQVKDFLVKLAPILKNPVLVYIGGNLLIHALDEKHLKVLDEKSAADFKGGLIALSTVYATAMGVGAGAQIVMPG